MSGGGGLWVAVGVQREEEWHRPTADGFAETVGGGVAEDGSEMVSVRYITMRRDVGAQVCSD